MKKLILWLGVVLSLGVGQRALAFGYSDGDGRWASVNGATNNIPTAYSTAAGSQLVFQGPTTATNANLIDKAHISVTNYSAGRIAVSFGRGACASTNTDQMVVGAASSNTKDLASVGRVVCIRSLTGGVINAGIVDVEVW